MLAVSESDGLLLDIVAHGWQFQSTVTSSCTVGSFQYRRVVGWHHHARSMPKSCCLPSSGTTGRDSIGLLLPGTVGHVRQLLISEGCCLASSRTVGRFPIAVAAWQCSARSFFVELLPGIVGHGWQLLGGCIGVHGEQLQFSVGCCLASSCTVKYR